MLKHSITPFINKSDMMMFLNQYLVVLYKTQKFLGQSRGWITNSVINHNINISKYNSLRKRFH